MGVSASKNKSSFDVISSTLSENLNNSFVQISQMSVSSVSPTQVIKIIARAGQDVTISGMTQKTIAKIDVQKFLSNVTETELKSKLTAALEATAKENQAVESGLTIGGSYSSNTSDTAVRQINVNRVVNSYSYTQFVSEVNQIFSSQVIDLNLAAARDVNVEDINQYISVELLSKQMADVMTKTLQDIVNESSATVKKELTQTTTSGFSFSFGQYMIFIVVLVVIIAIVAGIWYFKGGGKEMIQEQLEQMRSKGY